MKFIGKFVRQNIATSTNLVPVADHVELVRGRDSGTAVFGSFEAALLQGYRGFEFDCDVADANGWDQPEAVRFALLHENQRWIFDADSATWIIDAGPEPQFISAKVMRDGIRLWPHQLTLECEIRRYADQSSPQLKSVRFGYECHGNDKSHLLEFSLPEFFSRQIKLKRWITASGQPLPEIAPEIIESVEEFDSIPGSGSNILAVATINLPTCLMGNRSTEHQIEQTPTVLLELGDSTDGKHIQTTESVRVTDSTADVYFTTRQYYQQMTAHIIAQTLADANTIADNLYESVSEQGVIGVEAYGRSFGILVNGDLMHQDTGDVIAEMQLPSISFSFLITNLSTPATVREMDIVEALEIKHMQPVSLT